MILDKFKVADLYQRYGFKVEKSTNDKIAVFTIHNGHYYNADIVELDTNVSSNNIFQQFTDSGYACKKRTYTSLDDVEDTLFKGFFTVKSSKERLRKSYEKFTSSLVSGFSKDSEYKYVNSKYFINGEEGKSNVITEIVNRLKDEIPTLFLIEAAAGFGKTCTAYELLAEIINKHNSLLPFFTELSRNRQAKIFRYILLDEIDNFFPSLSSKLVRLEIKEGKVPVILDGFDELLHTKLDDSDDINETMIETIGELLEGKAKVILTTRRTAIFDGDEFHDWMSSHKDDFNIIRIRIDEPTIGQWLSEERIELLKNNNFTIEKLSNPVLLSFLRSISDEEFNNVVSKPQEIVQKYFELMLDRERQRQELNMTVEEQYLVFTKLSKNMIESSYTSESREYIVMFFIEYMPQLLEEVRKRYSNENRPTKEELANKLASHALLDRSNVDNIGIGFINEFVLGNFCAENIINEEEEFFADDIRFISPAVTSYIPRVDDEKQKLWKALSFVLSFVDESEKIKYMLALNNEIVDDINNATIENLIIKDIVLGGNINIEKVLFINCNFTNIILDNLKMTDVSFVDCSFYESKIINMDNDTSISLLGCSSDNNIEDLLIKDINDDNSLNPQDNDKACEIFILEKFWPKGRVTFFKHRHIKGIYTGHSNFSHKDILKAFDRLRKKDFILQPNKVSFAELNTERISEIKDYMGRN